MQNTNVKWDESETKRIYNANSRSETLIQYLESRIFEEKLVDSCVDSPNYDRGYGIMKYYLDGGRVLTAAPRKREQHIHVVLFHTNMSDVRKKSIPLGNADNDVLLSEETHIDLLVEVIKHSNSPITVNNSVEQYANRTLDDWVHMFYEDKETLERIQAINIERDNFISQFSELEELRNREISISEFKKRLDQKAKKKFTFNGEKINKWGFSGPSGQMFFNQLHNQANYLDMLDEFTDLFTDTIELPDQQEGDFSWTKEKYEAFGDFVRETRKRAIEKGFSPQKCASIKSMVFFVSFFWGIQDLATYPMYYKASRDGLNYLGYVHYDDQNVADSVRYINFIKNFQTLQADLIPYIHKIDEYESVDMHFISHFLYFVKEKIEEETIPGDGPELDPLALTIRDVLDQTGYKLPHVAEVDNQSVGLEEEYDDQLMWHYSGDGEEEDIIGLLIIWEDEESYNSDVYFEYTVGQFISKFPIRSEEKAEFLKELESYLKKKKVTKKPYTLDDVAKETYIEREQLDEWLELLTEFKQVILYGPPGTGKTFLAQRLAKVLTQSSQLVHLIQFHPSYTYEEFIEGIKPKVVEVNQVQQLSVNIESGIFTKLCEEARKPENSEKSFVLIIDEINRANTAKVFGELLYALEYRNHPIQRPYSRRMLVIPENVYLIGTMNTTDRSLAKLDFALRRRFQFIPFSTSETENVLERYLSDHKEDASYVARLVRKVNDMINNPDVAIGHSYFMVKDLSEAKLRRIWKYQIYPYLEECFVHDPEQLAQFKLEDLLDMDDRDE